MQNDETTLAELRNRMVSCQLIQAGIYDKRVLDSMLFIPRHKFVPPEQIYLAYEDRPLAIGEGQTISQPFIVAYMTQVLELKGTEKVLEIGSGSGYQTALLAMLAKEVYSIELHSNLAVSARKRLEEMKFTNFHILLGDGYGGWPQYAPYDAVIVTAAPPELPLAVIEQLALYGRMVVPVGEITQDLWLIQNLPGGVQYDKLIPVIFVPMVPKEQYYQNPSQ